MCVSKCQNVFNVWPKATLLQCGPEMPKGWTPLGSMLRFADTTVSKSLPGTYSPDGKTELTGGQVSVLMEKIQDLWQPVGNLP